MGKETGISWTESTWNPWMGCTKVSPGCAHCYMFREQRQYGNDPELVRRSKTKFREPVKWAEGNLVFTCSWSDWFHEAADEWRPEAWEIIRETPRHTYQILTKRPELIADRLPPDWGDGYPNVWLGVSVENSRFTWRVDELRQIPAALRFISAEPLLGSLFEEPRPLDGHSPAGALPSDDVAEGGPAARGRAPLDLTGIGWLIVGGESGSRRESRPMHPDWARELRDAVMCQISNDVAFHFKQWGSWAERPGASGIMLGDVCLSADRECYVVDRDYVCAHNESDGTWMRYAGPGPKSGGKLLDGVEYCEIPSRPSDDQPKEM